jgi:hypothetical protein
MTDGSQDDSTQFRRFAEKCIRIADKVLSVEDKAALLVMAQEWILLAEHQMGRLPKEPQRS